MATSTSKGLLKQAKLSNTLQIIWMVIVVIGFFIGSFYGSKLMGIYPTKDTINIPGSFDLQNEGDDMGSLDEAYLNFKISGTGRYVGGCIPYAPGSSMVACQNAGYRDSGCGWDEDTACSCSSTQMGCHKEIAYFPSDVKIYCRGIEIPYSCTSGVCRTGNFANAFPTTIPEDFILSCSVNCGSSGQLTGVTLETKTGTIEPPIVINPEKWVMLFDSDSCIKTTNYEGMETYDTELECLGVIDQDGSETNWLTGLLISGILIVIGLIGALLIKRKR
jgi:hypothetical protein